METPLPSLASDTDIRARWLADPVLAAEEIFGVVLWEGQKRVLRSIWEHKYTAVPSGHGTGKSFICALAVCLWMLLLPNAQVRTLANTFVQVETVLWKQIHDLHRLARARGMPLGGDLFKTEWRMPDGGLALGLSPDNPNALQGAHGEFVLVVVDECIDIEEDMWVSAESLVQGDDCRLIGIANPTKNSTPFSRICRDRQKWNVIRLSCLDHPNVIENRDVIPGAVTRKWVDEQLRKSGGNPDHQHYAVRVKGEFPKSDGFTLITRDLIERAWEMRKKRVFTEARHMGVDPASSGIDFTAVTITEDGMPIRSTIKFRESDTGTLARALVEIAKEYDVRGENIHVDSIGIGKGVADNMVDFGMQVDRVTMSGQVEYDWPDHIAPDTKMANRRMELYWITRIRLERGEIAIPLEMDQLIEDLTAPTYSYQKASGALLLEDKPSIRKRLGRSPDEGDSFVMSQSRLGDGQGVW